MMRKLMKMLEEGGAHSQAELASRLGVSAGLVEQMLQDLRRKGYLEHVDEKFRGNCTSCPLGRMCSKR